MLIPYPTARGQTPPESAQELLAQNHRQAAFAPLARTGRVCSYRYRQAATVPVALLASSPGPSGPGSHGRQRYFYCLGPGFWVSHAHLLCKGELKKPLQDPAQRQTAPWGAQGEAASFPKEGSSGSLSIVGFILDIFGITKYNKKYLATPNKRTGG